MAKRRGWKTSEFWISLLTTVGVVTAAVAGAPITAPVAAGLVTASGIAYCIARGLTKLKEE